MGEIVEQELIWACQIWKPDDREFIFSGYCKFPGGQYSISGENAPRPFTAAAFPLASKSSMGIGPAFSTPIP